MASGYSSAGERCMATSVAVAVGRIADELIERLAPRVRSLKIGGGMEPDLDMGPLVTAAHRAKVSGYIDDQFLAISFRDVGALSGIVLTEVSPSPAVSLSPPVPLKLRPPRPGEIATS